MNVNKILNASRDVGFRAGDVMLPNVYPLVDAGEFLASAAGRTGFFRMIVRSERTGRWHDVQGRQGVYASAQEGPVAGVGRPMLDVERGRFGILTFTSKKVNLGAGHGYRSWLRKNVAVIVSGGIVMVTLDGVDEIASALRRQREG
jgi:hypothetical protein